METLKHYLVNSFAEDGFEGNPAAVCIMDKWPTEAQMQNVALVNNLSETAFCVCLDNDKSEPLFHIRWFTPGCEVDLCGHATLATAFVLFKYYFNDAKVLHFKSRSGDLHVSKTEDFVILMDFPSYGLEKVSDHAEIKAVEEVLKPLRPKEIYRGTDYVAVFDKAEDVKAFKPDFKKIASLPGAYNLLITARDSKYDFASRCFFPKEAIDEDPVTGSAHCTLGPLWAKILGKTELTAYQASARGGVLHLKVSENSVIVGGKEVEV